MKEREFIINSDAKQSIWAMEEAGYVELIRCKNCKYGREAVGNIQCHRPGMGEYEFELHPLEWFCADGDKRD